MAQLDLDCMQLHKMTDFASGRRSFVKLSAISLKTWFIYTRINNSQENPFKGDFMAYSVIFYKAREEGTWDSRVAVKPPPS